MSYDSILPTVIKKIISNRFQYQELLKDLAYYEICYLNKEWLEELGNLLLMEDRVTVISALHSDEVAKLIQERNQKGQLTNWMMLDNLEESLTIKEG